MNLFEDISINTVVEQLSSEQSEMLKKAPKCAALKGKQKHNPYMYVLLIGCGISLKNQLIKCICWNGPSWNKNDSETNAQTPLEGHKRRPDFIICAVNAASYEVIL